MTTKVFDGVLFVSGRGRVSLRLLPLSALESGDVKSAAMKVADTEGMEMVFNFVWKIFTSVAYANRCICIHVW